MKKKYSFFYFFLTTILQADLKEFSLLLKNLNNQLIELHKLLDRFPKPFEIPKGTKNTDYLIKTADKKIMVIPQDNIKKVVLLQNMIESHLIFPRGTVQPYYIIDLEKGNVNKNIWDVFLELLERVNITPKKQFEQLARDKTQNFSVNELQNFFVASDYFEFPDDIIIMSVKLFYDKLVQGLRGKKAIEEKIKKLPESIKKQLYTFVKKHESKVTGFYPISFVLEDGFNYDKNIGKLLEESILFMTDPNKTDIQKKSMFKKKTEKLTFKELQDLFMAAYLYNFPENITLTSALLLNDKVGYNYVGKYIDDIPNVDKKLVDAFRDFVKNYAFKTGNVRAFSNIDLKLSVKEIYQIKPEKFKVEKNTLNLAFLNIDNLQELAKFITDPWSVRVLNLTSNRISNLPDAIFKDFINLEKLNLDYNRIHALKSKPFEGLKELKEVNLSENPIKTILPGVFSNLSSLEKIILPASITASIAQTLAKNLKPQGTYNLQNHEVSIP